MRQGLLTLLAMGLSCMAILHAQSPDMVGEERDMIRVTRQPDGTRSIYTRSADQPGMLCAIYTSNGILAAKNHYLEGKYGQLVACHVYNNNNKVIYMVAYGYDKNARLIEERMYSNPDRKLVQRVIYKYDDAGNRSKPIIISLNKGSSLRATAEDDINSIHRNNNKPR